jgi:NMD protein affecting ribosome stability and mRNA decay
MRSNKRYTNTTFTRRVDHEAGKHRPPRAATEPRQCSECGAIYHKRRWVAADLTSAPALEGLQPLLVVCPACKQKRAGVWNGHLEVSGDFLPGHWQDIEHLLRNEADRAAEDNPLARIIDWKKRGSRLKVTTTTEHLAQRLGHALDKAFDGQVRYDFSHENKVARVTWRRD